MTADYCRRVHDGDDCDCPPPMCLRFQQVDGDRLTFSCECAGVGCPLDPRLDRSQSITGSCPTDTDPGDDQ